jgi:predicted nucleic acid-binding protein
MPLADTLLTAATFRLFQLRWSADLLQEVRETMVKHRFPAAAVERRCTALARAFRNAEVTGYQELIPLLQLPDPDDRHVLATAIQARAQVIVTANRRDFPSAALSAHGVSATSPSDFLVGLTREYPQEMLSVVREQASPFANHLWPSMS